nr:hypothetical protein [Tanacetum cinerariifolium]
MKKTVILNKLREIRICKKNLALIAKYFIKIYKPTNNNLRTSSNSRIKNVDTTPRYRNDDQSVQFRNKRTMNVVGGRENVGSPVVQQTGIQCFNYKEFGHFTKECRKPKRVKDSTYHKEKMLLCKQAETGVPLQAEQFDWLADTDEEIDEQELEAHYSYMAKIKESWNQDSSRRTVNVEETPPKAMAAIDEVGFDWSYMAEDEPEFQSYRPKSCETESKNASKEIPNERKESPNAPLVKNRVSDNKDCTVESPIVVEKKTVVPTVAKIEFVKAKQQEKPVRKPVKYAEMYRERVVSMNNYTRVTYNNSTRKTHPNAHRNNAPVLMKISLRPLNTARPVNTVHPKTTIHCARPVNTARLNPVNTARPRPVNTVRPRPITTAWPNLAIVNAVRENKGEGSTILVESHHTPSEVAKVHTYAGRRRAISTASGGISTAKELVSTAGASMPVSTAGMVDKGKAIMQESKPKQTTTKLQQRQERAGYEAIVRLQEQLDKEERQRIAGVHEEASSFNVDEWEDIQAIIEANEELALRIQVEEREKYFEAEKARLLQLKRLSFDELKNLFEVTMKRVQSFTPMESDVDRTIPKITDESSKRAAEEEELKHESSKRKKTGESSKLREKEDDELTQEDLQ